MDSESKKIYVGSSVDFADRLSRYFSSAKLKQMNNYISRAIIHHGHSAFSLDILEYIDISNLGKEDARKLILEREQSYLNIIFSQEDKRDTYNILKTAGSLLDFNHSAETKALISEAISLAQSGEKNSMFGKTHSAETKTKISATQGTAIYIYDLDGSLVNSFTSVRKAALHFDVSNTTILKYVLNKNILKKNGFYQHS